MWLWQVREPIEDFTDVALPSEDSDDHNKCDDQDGHDDHNDHEDHDDHETVMTKTMLVVKII